MGKVTPAVKSGRFGRVPKRAENAANFDESSIFAGTFGYNQKMYFYAYAIGGITFSVGTCILTETKCFASE